MTNSIIKKKNVLQRNLGILIVFDLELFNLELSDSRKIIKENNYNKDSILTTLDESPRRNFMANSNNICKET